MVDVVCRPDKEHLVAGIELAHQHQRLLDELDLVLSHVVPVVAARQKTVDLIDKQDGRALLAGPGEHLRKLLRSRNVRRSDRVETAPRLGRNQVRNGGLACTGRADQK